MSALDIKRELRCRRLACTYPVDIRRHRNLALYRLKHQLRYHQRLLDAMRRP